MFVLKTGDDIIYIDNADTLDGEGKLSEHIFGQR